MHGMMDFLPWYWVVYQALHHDSILMYMTFGAKKRPCGVKTPRNRSELL